MSYRGHKAAEKDRCPDCGEFIGKTHECYQNRQCDECADFLPKVQRNKRKYVCPECGPVFVPPVTAE